MREVLKHFIAFEGLDGAGTTTQAKLLHEFLISKAFHTSLSAEPSKSVIGEFIRREILASSNAKVSPTSLMYLYVADRNEHIHSLRKELEANPSAFAISDRYFFSSIAYQGVELDPSLIERANEPFPLPEILLYIRVPLETCLRRIASRNEPTELFEKEEYLQKVSKLYEEIFARKEKYPGSTIFILDGEKGIEDLSREIRGIVSKFYGF